MSRSIDRRTFLKASTTTAVALLGGSLVPSRSAAQSDKLVVAVGQWGLETPFAWRSSQSEKTLWECVYDSLITRDPKTFAIRPGLATEWKPSNEMRTWTFKLRRAQVRGLGGAAEDVKFTIEQNLKPDSPGAPRRFPASTSTHRDPTSTDVALQEPPVECRRVRIRRLPEHRRRNTSRPWARRGGAPHRHRSTVTSRPAGRPSPFEAVPKHRRQMPAFKELVVRRIPTRPRVAAAHREIDIGQVLGDYSTRRSGRDCGSTRRGRRAPLGRARGTAPTRRLRPTCRSR
jgi:hypothetical protein